MKGLKLLLTATFFILMLSVVKTASAQCAMCSTTVETNAKSGGHAANGLNKGIMFLLGAPYLAVGIVGYIWYKKYRRKNVNLKMRGEKLHLN